MKAGRGDISIRSDVALTHILNAVRIEIVVLDLLTINNYRVLWVNFVDIIVFAIVYIAVV